MKDFSLTSNDIITKKIKAKGIQTWAELLNYTQQLPYGRNANRLDVSLVLSEEKGTCSSKHAFLKKVADLNSIPDVKLILAIYKMNEDNTKGIGNTLSNNNIRYIPEAHCYLKIDDIAMDITSSNSDFNKIKSVILLEQEIEPEQVATYKVDFHKNYLKNWLEQSELAYTFNELWAIRETCIQNLSV